MTVADDEDLLPILRAMVRLRQDAPTSSHYGSGLLVQLDGLPDGWLAILTVGHVLSDLSITASAHSNLSPSAHAFALVHWESGRELSIRSSFAASKYDSERNVPDLGLVLLPSDAFPDAASWALSASRLSCELPAAGAEALVIGAASADDFPTVVRSHIRVPCPQEHGTDFARSRASDPQHGVHVTWPRSGTTAPPTTGDVWARVDARVARVPAAEGMSGGPIVTRSGTAWRVSSVAIYENDDAYDPLRDSAAAILRYRDGPPRTNCVIGTPIRDWLQWATPLLAMAHDVIGDVG